MLKRPSLRRRSKGTQEIELPLVPIMDAFVTLIAFLLMATSILAVTLIDTPIPILSTLPDDSKEKPLTLTAKVTKESIRLESPFQLIQPISITVESSNAHLDKFREALLSIKKLYPREKKIIFMPSSDTSYNDIIQLMDNARTPRKTDDTIFVKGENGTDTPIVELFPDVIFGNIVGEGGGS